MSQRKDGTKGVVAFAIGSGRCGTQFLADVLSREPDVAASHERNPLLETFHRYAKWYQLPIDDEGFLRTMEQAIARDLSSSSISFESSAHLSFSVKDLHRRFSAKFVLLVRRPDRVVNSYLHKGLYITPIYRSDANSALGFQQTDQFHHFLGRIVPSGEEFERWQAMTRVGKVAWFWSAVNQAVLQQLDELPASQYRIVRLEDFDFKAYQSLGQFLGFQPIVDEHCFKSIVQSRPNTKHAPESLPEWTDQEVFEFESQVATLAEHFDYEFRVERLRQAQPVRPAVDSPPDRQRAGLMQRIARRLWRAA